MMVGTYRQHLACVAEQLNGVKRHRSMKLSSRDPQLGLASPLNYAANQSGKIKSKAPLRRRQGLDVSHHPQVPARGRGRIFFLTSSFIGSNGVEHHRSMKLLSWDQQLGLASPLPYAANQSGKTKTPLRTRQGWMQVATPRSPRRERRRIFSLTSSFIGRV